MDLKQAVAALRKGGTAQNRKIYGRHGVAGEMFGVSYALQKKLAKQAGTDHELAVGLWATGNHDARILACMVADAFAGVVIRGPHRLKKFAAWKNRKDEFVSAAAWNILASQALHDQDLTDAFCLEQIQLIAREIHTRPNRTRHSMNQALICLGVRNPRLEKAARAAAKRIGKVAVDHGQTSCTTPDAADYMTRTLAYREKKAGK